MFASVPVITETGITLLLRAAGGEQITFTKFQAGSGILTEGETPKTMTAMKNVVLNNIPITQAEDTEEEGYIQLSASFDNQTDVENDFRWTELGLIAEDENGNEYLYAYGYDNENAELIQAAGGSVILEQHINVVVAIGESENITVYVIPNATYAGKAEFDAHVEDESNPHHVTALQVGAAPTIHNHSATNITSGILPEARGGTGYNTLAKMASAMGLGFAFGQFTGDGTQRKDIELGFKPVWVILITANNFDRQWPSGAYYIDQSENIYYSGGPTACRTETANQLFNRGRGGAAITSNGFAVGYSADSLPYINRRPQHHFYIAKKPNE